MVTPNPFIYTTQLPYTFHQPPSLLQGDVVIKFLWNEDHATTYGDKFLEIQSII
jgi:hypothetical protein